MSPSKKWASVDHWNYWNRNGDIPSDGSGIVMPRSIYPNGIIKDPVFSNASAGILKKIVYPTGGSTVFTYEPNLINNGLNYVTNNLTDNDFINRLDTNSTNLLSHTTTFVINTAQTVKVITSRVPKLPVTSGTNDPNGPNAPTKDTSPEAVLTSGSFSHSFSILTNNQNSQKVDSILLQPGTYSMLIQCDAKENQTSATVTYYQKTNQVIEGTLGPGIRVKSIVHYTDSLSANLASSKIYSYKDTTGVSTGVLLNTPIYGGDNYEEITYGPVPPGDHIYKLYTSANGNGLMVSQDMYYQKVFENQISPADTLMSESDFNVFAPFTLTGTLVYLNKNVNYKKVNGIYTPVDQHDYSYAIVTDSSFSATKPHLIRRRIPGGTIASGVPADQLREYTHSDYEVDPSWLELVSEKEFNYYNSDTVITTKKYAYDAKPRNRIWMSVTDSKGATKIEKDKYPENYSTAVTNGLTSHAVFSPLLEKQIWLKRSATDSVLINGIITDYNQSIFKPAVLYGFENIAPVTALNQETTSNGLYTNILSDSKYHKRIMNGYNSSSNLSYQDMTNSDSVMQVVYLWGYHNNYPIAQVKNADPTAAAYTSFEDDDNSWTYNAANVITTDARTGTKCYNGTISKSSIPKGNYTVTMWAKGSGTITIVGVTQTISTVWTQYQWQLTGVSSISITSNGNLIDEVRLIPANALMTTYTYIPEVGVSSATDNSGLTSYYEYDEMERLVNIKDKDGNIIKHIDYHYQGQ